VGGGALNGNATGNQNTAVGVNALETNPTGFQNIALGVGAGESLTTGEHNIYIGNVGASVESDTIRIGDQSIQAATFIAGISGVTIMTNSAPVAINTMTGQLGTQAPSSQRFKDDIKPMNKVSEAILAFKPVTFHYKKDPTRTAQFGLVAEEVEKINPDLITRGPDGKPYTVRYEAVNAMLLNEFLKEHQKVQKLEAALAAVNERLKEQDAKIDKVNAKVELAKSAPQTVLNN